MTPTLISQQIRLTHRPSSGPSAQDFAVVPVPVPRLSHDEVLVRNTHFALGAVMRGLILDTSTALPPYAVNAPLFAPAIGEIVESTSQALPVGQLVRHRAGWRDFAWGPASEFMPLDTVTIADPVAHLIPGPVAYAGLHAVARVGNGDSVLVTGAAGSVGSIAGQVARLLGAAQVIGTVGSPDKAAWAENTLGYDRVLNRHDHDLSSALRAAAPDGLDVVFDTAGGAQLQSALENARPRARLVLCGALAAQLGDGSTSVELDVMNVIGKRLTIAGFTPADHSDLTAEWSSQLATWLAAGKISLPEHRVNGLHAAIPALIELFAGRTRGTVVIHLDDADH